MKLASMANYQQDGIISVEYDPITGTGSAKVMINGQEINIGGGSTMLKCTYTGEHLDKNIGEIYDAYMAGSAVLYEGDANENGSGTWSLLKQVRIVINNENTCYGEVTFEGNTLVTDMCADLEAVRAAYPVFSD